MQYLKRLNWADRANWAKLRNIFSKQRDKQNSFNSRDSQTYIKQPIRIYVKFYFTKIPSFKNITEKKQKFSVILRLNKSKIINLLLLLFKQTRLANGAYTHCFTLWYKANNNNNNNNKKHVYLTLCKNFGFVSKSLFAFKRSACL